MTGKNGMKSALLFFVFLFCAAGMIGAYAPAACAEESKLFFLSPTYGWYFPTSGKTKDAFGDSWEGFGVALNLETLGWSRRLAIGELELYPYFGYFHGENGPNDAYVIPIGLEGRWYFAAVSVFRPYIGAGVAGYGVKLEDNRAGVDTGWRGAFGGRVMAGVDITKYFTLQASYHAITEVSDYDLSGFNVLAKLNFYF